VADALSELIIEEMLRLNQRETTGSGEGPSGSPRLRHTIMGSRRRRTAVKTMHTQKRARACAQGQSQRTNSKTPRHRENQAQSNDKILLERYVP